MEKKQTYQEAVLKVVMWWCDKSFRTPLNQNNGDDSHQGGAIYALMNTASMRAQEKITPHQIKVFENKLIELLMNCRRHERVCDVDYHPCQFLREAAGVAGIDYCVFPCKSYTNINDENRVFAKYQYGNPAVEI